MSDLKPCPNPWCDGPAVLHDDLLRVDDTGTGYDAAVSCLHCDNSTPCYRSPAEAIAAWNTRADTAKDAEIARLREALNVMQGYGCPVCNGDCGSANPPVIFCPMQTISQALGASHDA